MNYTYPTRDIPCSKCGGIRLVASETDKRGFRRIDCVCGRFYAWQEPVKEKKRKGKAAAPVSDDEMLPEATDEAA